VVRSNEENGEDEKVLTYEMHEVHPASLRTTAAAIRKKLHEYMHMYIYAFTVARPCKLNMAFFFFSASAFALAAAIARARGSPSG